MDLIKRHYRHISALVTVKDDGPQINMNHFRPLAISHMRAYDIHLVRRCLGCDPTGALKQFQNGFFPLVGHGTLQTHDLAKKVNTLSVVVGDSDMHPGCRHSGNLGKELGNLLNRGAFHAGPAGRLQIQAAIDTDGMWAA